MKNLLALLFIVCTIVSCSKSETPVDKDEVLDDKETVNEDDSSDNDETSNDDSTQENAIYEAPATGSYVTYISQNSVTLNGFIDHSNKGFLEDDSFKRGFIFRGEDETDSSNDQVIELEGEIEYFTGTYSFDYDIDSLEPNTTYHYASFTKNGASEKDHWQSFTTSAMPCSYDTDNYYNNDYDFWKDATVQITDGACCGDGSIGFKFGSWPNTFEIRFNEKDNGYPKTGQYFGIDYEFSGTHIEKDLVLSTNQVLIGNNSTPETELFVINDGEKITLVFCNTQLRDGSTLEGKVSVTIPED